jgi:hypothetical protein
LLILLALPGLGRFLEHAGEGSLGDEPLSLHGHAGENERRPARMQVVFANRSCEKGGLVLKR